jgi:vacuolar-type H+-ATPase subunit H
MPYYIYRVTPVGPIRQLAKITQFEAFKEASTEAKRLRRESELRAGRADQDHLRLQRAAGRGTAERAARRGADDRRGLLTLMAPSANRRK